MLYIQSSVELIRISIKQFSIQDSWALWTNCNLPCTWFLDTVRSSITLPLLYEKVSLPLVSTAYYLSCSPNTKNYHSVPPNPIQNTSKSSLLPDCFTNTSPLQRKLFPWSSWCQSTPIPQNASTASFCDKPSHISSTEAIQSWYQHQMSLNYQFAELSFTSYMCASIHLMPLNISIYKRQNGGYNSPLGYIELLHL